MGFRVGTEGSCTDNRSGYLQRQGRRHLPRSSQQVVAPDRLRHVRLDLASVRIPPSREIAKGEFLLLGSQFLLVAFPHSRICHRVPDHGGPCPVLTVAFASQPHATLARLFVSISGAELLGHRVQVFETIVPTVGAPWLAQDRDPPRRRLISSPVLLGFPMPGRKMSISPAPSPAFVEEP